MLWLLLAISSTALGADPARAEIRSLAASGRDGRAAWVARRWLADDPSEAVRWVALAEVEPDPRAAEPLFREALRIDPHQLDALVGLGRTLTALGQREAAVSVLERAVALAPDARDPALAMAEATSDAGLARAVLTRFPGDADAALLVARLDPADAARVLALPSTDPRVLAARIEGSLATGDVENAELALAGLDPDSADAERLARAVACERAGTLDPQTWSSLTEARRAAIVSPGTVVDVDALVGRAPDCTAAWVVRASLTERRDPEGAARALEAAMALAPMDSAIAVTFGRVALTTGRIADALRVLEPAVEARPWDPDAAALLGVGLVRAGRADEARTLLADAGRRFPEHAGLALARADAAASSEDALAMLLEVLRVSHDRRVEARARSLAEGLDRQADLVAAMSEPERVPVFSPLPEEVSEEITVTAERPSKKRLEELIVALADLGYGPPVTQRDGDLLFAEAGPDRPWVVLHPSGLVDLDNRGSKAERRRRGAYRWEVLQEMKPALLAWREALCAEGFEERLLVEIPDALDRVWREGVPLSGDHALETPSERRLALLDWWATRTCTPEGEQVRELVARYLRHEVQASPWPVTADEIAAVNARRSCADPLVLQ